MDCYADSIDAHLEEEDVVADQLKEYLYFGQSLQELCSRYQMAQFRVEKAESHLSAQKYQKEKSNASQDGVLTKLWGKVTGTTETFEEQQAKIQTMERNVNQAQSQLEAASTQLRFQLGD